MIRLRCRGRCSAMAVVERRRRHDWTVEVELAFELAAEVAVALGALVVPVRDALLGAGAAGLVTNWAMGGPGNVYDAPRLKTWRWRC